MSLSTHPLSRRALMGGLLGVGAAAVVPLGAAAAAPVIKGRIKETYLAAGGAKAFGKPLANEVKVAIDSHNTYGQRFAHGRVWWGSGVGLVDLPGSRRVRLASAPNFRPVLGVRDVWRTDDLDGCSALEERVVRDLDIRTMIAMNTGSDPSITGVQRLTYSISNAGSQLEFYRGYVSRPASRASVGEVLAAVAASSHPVLIHCQGGKDRTGWLSDLLQRLGGVRQAQRDADYLATKAYSGGAVDLAWLQAARNQLLTDYGSIDAYLTKGCGLSAQTVAAVRARVTPR